MKGFINTCLSLIILLTGAGTILYDAHIHPLIFSEAPRMPALSLSTVIHGDAARWCYDPFKEKRGEEFIFKKEIVNKFKKFIENDLAQYAVSVSKNHEGTTRVLYQATPHNRCELIFESAGGGGMSVTRRRFSTGPSIVSAGDSAYRVRTNLTQEHLHSDTPVEDAIGVIPGLTVDSLSATHALINLAPTDLSSEAEGALSVLSGMFSGLFDDAEVDDSDAASPVKLIDDSETYRALYWE